MAVRLVVIGGGNMAGAIIRGALDAAVLAPSEVVVCDPDTSKHPAFAALNVFATPSHAQALRSLTDAAQLLLGVKPQMLGAVADQLRAHWPAHEPVVISILAGTPSAKVRAAFGDAARVVRAMPNMAAGVRHSTTALCLGAGARPDDDAFAERLFHAIGPLVVRADESMMDAFTAVAGSGPAYLFYLAEAMTAAAVDLGFDAPTADRMVRETLAGAATLLSASPDPPATLRASVTSKRGTTEAAIGVMDAHAVKEAIIEALKRAQARGAELARGA